MLAPILLLLTGTAFAKTDVVVFTNGDRLTGEVKSLERGRLRFKTEATDTINIEWDKVAYLSSDQNIQVETVQGVRHLGHLAESDKRKTLIVQTDSDAIEVSNIRVVKMTPIEARGLDRFDGEITAGYNFTKADETTQLNLGVEINYRTELRIVSINLDTVLTDSAVNEENQRQSFTLETKRLLRNRWLWGANLSLDRNDELGIDMRTSIGAGGGRILRQTDHSSVVLEAGLKATKEDLAGSTTDEETLESYGLMTWDWFRYDTPELDLSTSLEVIPNLSDTGRVRGELDITFKWEMVEDLFWQLSLYDSYDSRDYGIVTSLGYDF
jgi:hypothetical protein